MYEPDGSVMVYWHALDSENASPGTCRTEEGGGRECSRAGGCTISNSFTLSYSVQAVFARGIASSGHFICVGEGSKGRVLGVLGYKGVGFG